MARPYMKIQNPSSALDGCMTPLKVRIMMNIRVAMMPSVSASDNAEITCDANVEVKIWNWTTKRSIRAWQLNACSASDIEK